MQAPLAPLSMSPQSTSTRQRLIQAALELFVSQGVSSTTTRQIANLAEVNEVTLFRHFGNKYGLLLVVIEESPTFTNLGDALIRQLNPSSDLYQVLKEYGNICLHTLEQVPELVRSLIGEADQYPVQNQQALGQKLTEANRYVAQYLAKVIQQGHPNPHLPPEKLASLLNGLLLGYTVIEFTSNHELWQDRDEFLENLVQLFLHGAVSLTPTASSHVESRTEPGVSSEGSILETSGFANARAILDLPATLVHTILQQARKLGHQDYALAYVLFGAGLSPTEIISLQKSHQISDTRRHILQVTTARGGRQVPVNQWILGKRYGSYTNNPLTKWLKTRKDQSSAMFLNNASQPISEAEIQHGWQTWAEGLLTPEGQSPVIAQAQQTWCVEMLMRGMSLENLSILTGWELAQLQPYAHRAKEKAALEQATLLDQKIRSGVSNKD